MQSSMKSQMLKAGMIIFVSIILMVLWWNVRLQDKYAREEFIIESGRDTTFIAEFEEIHGIAFSNDNITIQSVLSEQPVSLELKITDMQEEILWNQYIESIQITSFEITEGEGIIGLPIKLEKGEQYRFSYSSEIISENSLTIVLYGKEKNLFALYMIVCVFILSIICTAICLWIMQTKVSMQLSFAIIYILLGLLYNVVLIPFSVQDEPTHFAQAYAISSEWLGKESVNEEGNIYIYESGLIRMNWCGDRQTEYRFWSNWHYGNYKEQRVSGIYTKASNLPEYVYYVPAVGITIARILNAPYQVILYAGRLFNLLLFVFICALSMKFSGILKDSILAILLIPSVIWVGISYSYDAWNFEISLLLFSYCMYCRQRERLCNWKDVIVLVCLGAVLVPVKFIYFIMSFSVLLIPKEKFKGVWQRSFSCIFTIMGSIFFALKSRGHSAVSYVTTETVDVRSVSVADMERERYTIGWILENPVQTFKVYINTLFEQGENYIYKCINGSFLDIEVPKIIIYAILAVALIVMADNIRKTDWRKSDRFISAGIFAAGCGLVLTTFLFVYSFIYIFSVGTIAGVQGRYFLPFLVFLPFIIYNDFIQIKEEKKIYMLLLLLLLNLLALMCNFSAIIRRF